MKIIYENLPPDKKKCVATIGVFDGIHLGHEFIFKKLKQISLRHKVPSLVITFDRLPSMILKKDFSCYITDNEEKADLIESLGVDYLWFQKTNPSFLSLTGREFIKLILNHFSVVELVVGDDFRCGCRGDTGVESFKKLSYEFGFTVSVIKRKKKQGEVISSSSIRKLIIGGEFKRVKQLLGRDYSLKGQVGKGAGYGRQLGFPTANLGKIDYVIPSRGIYAAYTNIGRKKYKAAVYIGTKPTFTVAQNREIEVHIIGFRGNILDETIKIFFWEKIRNEKKFPTQEALKQAIEKDIRYIIQSYP